MSFFIFNMQRYQLSGFKRNRKCPWLTYLALRSPSWFRRRFQVRLTFRLVNPCGSMLRFCRIFSVIPNFYMLGKRKPKRKLKPIQNLKFVFNVFQMTVPPPRPLTVQLNIQVKQKHTWIHWWSTEKKGRKSITGDGKSKPTLRHLESTADFCLHKYCKHIIYRFWPMKKKVKIKRKPFETNVHSCLQVCHYCTCKKVYVNNYQPEERDWKC